MKDLTVTRPFSEEDYNELLQQAVAVIETSRLRLEICVDPELKEKYKELIESGDFQGGCVIIQSYYQIVMSFRA